MCDRNDQSSICGCGDVDDVVVAMMTSMVTFYAAVVDVVATEDEGDAQDVDERRVLRGYNAMCAPLVLRCTA